MVAAVGIEPTTVGLQSTVYPLTLYGHDAERKVGFVLTAPLRQVTLPTSVLYCNTSPRSVSIHTLNFVCESFSHIQIMDTVDEVF